MKKISLLLAMLMVLSLALVACGGNTPPADSGSGSGSTSASTDGGDDAGDEDIFFDPSLLQVKAIDDTTLEVTLPAKTPFFLELTAFPVYSPVPMHIVDEVGEAWATEAATYIGNGPYQVSEWVPNSHITMTRNENYWDPDNQGPKSIKFMLIEDNTAELNGFQSGELKFIDNPPQDEIANLQSDPAFHTEAQLGTYYVSMNNSEAPFDDINVRKAFSLAIDRDQIANVIGEGMYIPAGAWVAPNLTDNGAGTQFRDVGGDFYDPSKEAYEANLAEAKQALADAGYPDGEGFPTVTYIYNENDLHKAVAESLQDQWKQLGVDVQIEIQEWATFLNSRKNGDYQLARDGWLSDYNDPMSMLDLFITGGGNNNSQYVNADYDAMITSAKTTDDQAERFAIMHDMEKTLMEDWVFAPIMYYGDPYMCDPALDDSTWTSPLGYKYFMQATGYDNDELVVCVGPNPDTVDPALNSSVDGATMIIHSFEGLYRLDKDGVPEPAMAESHEVSEDGLVYTFKLREGVQWSDGTPITAQTFVDSWTRALDPMTAGDYAYMFEFIAGYSDALGGEGDH